MRNVFRHLTFTTALLALFLSLPALGLHGAAHGATTNASHVHHAPAHPLLADALHDPADIACKTLCTGPLLTTEIIAAEAPGLRFVHRLPKAHLLWTDWARPRFPPPKNAA